jgi:predicted AlkP superfamily pyrophosphatase or phosphodiesterase
MPMVLVSYDLNAPSKDYKALYDRLESYNGWSRLMDSTWVIFTSHGEAQSVARDLIAVIDKNDSLFTSIVNPGQFSGWMEDAKWTWLNS